MKRHPGFPALVLLVTVLAWPPSVCAGPQDAAVEHFEKKIRPLLLGRCQKCHGTQEAKGGLRLDSGDALRRGGGSGKVVIEGKPDESLLIQAVRYAGEVHMPPDGRLSTQQVSDLTAWIKAGAVWPGSAFRWPRPS